MALGPVSFGGLASGLDTKSIIDAILRAERKPVERLQARQSTLDARRTAVQEFNTKLTALRAVLEDLSAAGSLGARTAGSSDASIVTASATAAAEIGSHDVEVRSLARASRVRSVSVSGRSDPAVSDGTITIRSGSRTAVTIDVSSSEGNNSLVAIRDRINAAGAGIAASIVSDGDGDLLVVRSATTGVANALTIEDTTNLGLDDPTGVLDAAADATVVVDGVTIESATNVLTNAIQGVTLNLLGKEPGTTVTVSVAADTAKARDQIKRFVDAYGAVADVFRAQFSANPTTGRAGVLAGDALLRRVQDMLQTAVSGGVAGLPSDGLTTLGALGVAIDGTSGKLKIDEEKLSAALENRFAEIGRLFSASGVATDGAVSFGSVTSATKTGTYAVIVTRAPERAAVVGGAKIRDAGLAQAENLTITAGSVSATIALEQGDTIATVVGKINSALSSAGVSARASNDGGRLALRSSAYGNDATLRVVSDVADPDDGTTTGIGTGEISDSGVDIEGSIGGVEAIGSGSTLTGAGGNGAEGLLISVLTDPATVAARRGDFGSVTVTRGVADSLARDLKSVVDPASGLVASTLTRYDAETRRIRDEIASLEARLDAREVLLVRQFSAAEQAIQTLQRQQSALGKSYSLF